MDELAILFLYYRRYPEAAIAHYQRAVRLHPRDLVIPIAFEIAQPFIPGTNDVAADAADYGWPISDPYSQCDKIYYRWFLNPKRPRARRYIFYEYDILPNCHAREVYRDAWNADLAAADIADMQTDPGWCRWAASFGPPVEPDLIKLGTGVRPLAATLWSHDALSGVAGTRRMPGAWCEFRAGTLARYLGFRAAVIPGAIKTIHWPPTTFANTAAPAWFHPIKIQPPYARIRRRLRQAISTCP